MGEPGFCGPSVFLMVKTEDPQEEEKCCVVLQRLKELLGQHKAVNRNESVDEAVRNLIQERDMALYLVEKQRRG